MIYLDTSVALAYLLAEDRYPPRALFDEQLVASRLLEYELLTAINSRGLRESHLGHAESVLQRVALIELDRPILSRARHPFPLPLRTLDALHLATFDYLQNLGQSVSLASYDARMLEAARALGYSTVML